MRFLYSIKIKAYQFFNTSFGKSILTSLSKFVYASDLRKSDAKNRFPFIISITIDTEAGYVDKHDYRIWQKHNPRAYIGFYKGIENWRNLLNKHNAKATFFLSTNCFSSKGEEYKKIITQLRLLVKEGHEIGLHLHPDSDLALQYTLKKKFHATSANFYSRKDIENFIKTGKSLIKKHFGVNTASFRWGNWALNTNAVKALQKNGFKADSSATPGIKGHSRDEMAYDWSAVSERYPWKLSKVDYQNTSHQNSNVIEIPIATFNFFGLKLRADPANSVLLKACFDYYYKNADRSKNPFIFVVISHSSEATHQNGSDTKIIKTMGEFISYAKKFKDVSLDSLQNSCKLLE